MEQTQFTAVVLLTLLMLKLLLMPNKVVMNHVMGKSRWLMTIGIALLDLHFLLQYTLGLRTMGVTQAVMLNLLLFIPSSWAISLAVIYMQRQGQASHTEKMVGGITWAIVILLIGIGTTIDGQPLLSDSPELHWAEIAASIFYLTMQGYYAYRQIVILRAMRIALQNYYDHDMDGLLAWMKYSTIVLLIIALMVPMLIFSGSQKLSVFAIFFFVGIFYLVDTFCNYMVSSAPMKMAKAGASEELTVKREEEMANSEPLTATPVTTTEANSTLSAVHSSLIHKWIEKGGYRRSGLTMPAAAEEIGIPRYQLSAWIKQQELTYAAWMTNLRIDEAKRVIKDHPQWTNESIAQHCGFSDRSYFQKMFKEQTGLSPSEYQASTVSG